MYNIDKINKFLVHLQDEAAGIERLNWGGCGVFALKAGRALEAMGVSVGVLCLAYGHYSVDKARQRLRGRTMWAWLDAGLDAFNHLALELTLPDGSVWWYDSEHLVEPSHQFGCRTVAAGRLTLDELAPIVRSRKGWNRSFDRTTGYRKVARAIRRSFDLIV